MIKGCQRRMIMVKGEAESVFEAAYFVMKTLPEHDRLCESDMAAEAERIASGSLTRACESGEERKVRAKRRWWGRAAAFLMGLVLGIGATLAVVVLK